MKAIAVLRLWRSLTLRLALLYLGLFALSVSLLFALLYVVGIARPMQAAQALVEREAAALRETYIVEGSAGLVSALSRRSQQPSLQRPFHVFLAPDGRMVSTNMPSWPAKPQHGWRRLEADLYADGDEEDHEALSLDHVFDDGARLLVGRDIEAIDEREEFLAEAAAWSAAFTLLLGIAGGVLMSLTVGRRIDAVSRTARGVIGGNLSERVPVRGTGDDFDQLADTLNLMLSRIEESMESVRRVSDNVAHELRTPLARLHADLAELREAHGPEEMQRLIEQAGGEAARLQSIFNALFRITRIETGRHPAEMRPTDLSALLGDALDYYQPEAESRGQRLEARIEPGLVIEGDRDLLFQAIANLVDNALKHTPDGGEVSLIGQKLDREVSVGVLDTGPGIAPEHLGKVTERFYRVEPREGVPGIGLGLSFVAAVSRLHATELRLTNVVGLYAELRFPAVAGPAE